ncbi:hypothetical protein [Geopsychrobacter electrodiphilus]|nr:hypothetical protein [Geopsychrobacter electrodiphilus]
MYTPCSIINLADGFCHYFSAGYPLPDKEIDLPLSRDAYMRERSLFLS